jgi:alpha-tubulin suppressor-like RCC1 family protein
LIDGAVRCWGGNEHGELGNGTTTNSSTPVPVSDMTAAMDITTSFAQTCAALGDGRVQCWGWNRFGELGIGVVAQSTLPVGVVGLP